jgi:hypothetical protein
LAQLVTLLSTGKGSWAEVATLINKPEFDEVFILTNSFGKEKFTNLPNKRIEVIAFDFDSLDATNLSLSFMNALKSKLNFNDVALNISSGSGKEHMSLFSSLIKLGVGFRLVTLKENQVIEL